MTKQQLNAFILEAKKLFIDESRKTNNTLFPDIDSTDMTEGINEFDLDITFIDADGNGSVDALELDMDGVFSFGVGLVDKKEWQEKAAEVGISKKEGNHRIKKEISRPQKDAKITFINDKKLIDEINKKYAVYLKILRDDMQENGDIE